MQLSPWHMEIARRIAQGQPNREIKKDIQVSDSRLSVLKANPVFARQVEKYRKQEDDKYMQAMKVFADKAEEVAKQLTDMAISGMTPHHVKLQAGLAVLERLAQAEGLANGNGKQAGDDEIVFEQMLRVTRKGLGQEQIQELDSGDYSAAIEDLRADIKEPDMEDTEEDIQVHTDARTA